jgi:hypothetical protein
MTNTYQAEYTDTFGGDANYSWVRRASFNVPEWSAFKDWDGNGRREPKAYQRTVMRRAKAALGLSGLRGRTFNHGDMIEFRPYRMCCVLFITYQDA